MYSSYAIVLKYAQSCVLVDRCLCTDHLLGRKFKKTGEFAAGQVDIKQMDRPLAQHVKHAPSSEMTTHAAALASEDKWVPPQNSMEKALFSGFAGSARSCSTLRPTETTRTGSGYTSPNTALSLFVCIYMCVSVHACLWMCMGVCLCVFVYV
jgi:hypothetical protein